jgi:hypothetical protein
MSSSRLNVITDARDHGLPILNYVLHPRVAGLHTCLSSFKDKAEETRHSGEKSRFFVHDLTVAYKDYTEGIRTSEYSLINGNRTL